MIRVAVAASSAVVRAGLESVVRASDGFDLVGVMRADEVGDRLDKSAADVLLLELAQIDEEWIHTLAESPVPVVLLIENADPALLAAGFRANIRAVLSPDAGPVEIEAAIRSAAAGLITIQQSTLELLGTDHAQLLPRSKSR